MNELFDAVSMRLKAIFTAHAALELEAELINRHIERKVSLLKRASELEQQGLSDLATELRHHANEASLRRHTDVTLNSHLPAPSNTTNRDSTSDNNSTGKPTSGNRKTNR